MAPGEVLTHKDVYFAVPLLKGQLSTREFTGGETLTRKVVADGPLDVRGIDSLMLEDRTLYNLILDRGLDVEVPPRAAVAS